MALVFTRSTISGQVGYVPEEYLDHPVLGLTLEKVDEGTKPFHPEMHQERTPEKPEQEPEEDEVVEDEDDPKL